jgi:hypothetical protein
MGFQFQSVASTSAQLIDTFGLSYAEIGTLIGFFLLPGVFIAIPSRRCRKPRRQGAPDSASSTPGTTSA